MRHLAGKAVGGAAEPPPVARCHGGIRKSGFLRSVGWRFRWRRRHERFNLRDESGEVNSSHRPDQGVVNLAILMRQPVPLRHDRTPWDIRMCPFERCRHSVCGFADDLDLPLHRRSEKQVSFIIRKSLSCHERLHGARRHQHIQQPGVVLHGIVVITRHTPHDNCSLWFDSEKDCEFCLFQ